MLGWKSMQSIGLELKWNREPMMPSSQACTPTHWLWDPLVLRPNPITAGDLRVLAFSWYEGAICLGLGFDCKVIWPVPPWKCDSIHQEFSVWILGGWKAIDFKDAFYPRKNLKQESKSEKEKKKKKIRLYVPLIASKLMYFFFFFFMKIVCEAE